MQPYFLPKDCTEIYISITYHKIQTNGIKKINANNYLYLKDNQVKNWEPITDFNNGPAMDQDIISKACLTYSLESYMNMNFM